MSIFNPFIPQPPDIISESQGDLLINFSDLNTVYGTSGDHVALNAASDRGKHKKVTFVTQSADPETLENETVLFAKEEGTDTNLYLREESNGDINQFSKDGNLFTGIYPVFAINIKDPTPNTDTGFGTYNFTVSSSFNLDTATTKRLTANSTRYQFGFTNDVLDTAGSPTNDYFFTASGFTTSAPLVGQVNRNATYGDSVDPSFIQIEFVDQNGAPVATMTGATVICWRLQ